MKEKSKDFKNEDLAIIISEEGGNHGILVPSIVKIYKTEISLDPENLIDVLGKDRETFNIINQTVYKTSLVTPGKLTTILYGDISDIEDFI